MMCAGGIQSGCLKDKMQELPDKGHPLMMKQAFTQPSQKQQGVAVTPW